MPGHPATTSPYLVTVERDIDAPAQQLFDIVADPAMHPVIDGSGSVRATRGRVPDRLTLGATFSMDMHIRADYRIRNTVVEFDEGRQIGWRHFNGHVWRYRFEPLGAERTRVTEQWDARPARTRLFLRLVGAPGTVRDGMVRTLDRLAEVAVAP